MFSVYTSKLSTWNSLKLKNKLIIEDDKNMMNEPALMIQFRGWVKLLKYKIT